ncbi:MAG TPA: KH domain-containing protein [Methanofastidiosum sp.]|jgi:ribosomal RNA assembly protein|nr:KH domain-containing protein [Methanofastidiosum sp.]HPC81653.1 KH domain-containing protein [Methanofastidiosum sp.]HRS26314.1 KH domain-containing protein [Methanofastidiosum sp.]
MSEEFVKIPQDRLGVLIGKDGEVKRLIEKKLSIKLEIDSEEGLVNIYQKDGAAEPLNLWKARDIVRAIGRGFPFEKASKIFSDLNVFEMIYLPDYLGKSSKAWERQRGRVIGKDGSTRKTIEDLTNTDICVYGKTVSIIGDFDDVADAKEAIEMILEGKPHSIVYRYLEKRKKDKVRDFEDSLKF